MLTRLSGKHTVEYNIHMNYVNVGETARLGLGRDIQLLTTLVPFFHGDACAIHYSRGG